MALGVGDIISLCLLIKELCKTLDRSRTAPTEYRDIISDLWALDDALTQAEELCESHESSNELEAFNVAVSRAVNQCRLSVEKFHSMIRKFAPSFNEGGSRSIVKDTMRKVQWQVSHSDELTKFRLQVIAHCSLQSMCFLLLLACE